MLRPTKLYVPQILTNGQGNPDRTSMTLIMFLNNHLKSKNYGMAGALSVYLFIVSAILCFIVYARIGLIIGSVI